MNTLTITLAGSALCQDDEYELIRHLRAERGVFGATESEGQVRLARWMIGDDQTMAGVPISRFLGAFSDDELIRFLTGETEPEPSAANYIAERTEGAVQPCHWARRAQKPVAMPPEAAGETAGPDPSPWDRPSPKGRSEVGEGLSLHWQNGNFFLISSNDVVFLRGDVAASLHAQLGLALGGASA